jgi:hypothetical protein
MYSGVWTDEPYGMGYQKEPGTVAFSIPTPAGIVSTGALPVFVKCI